MIENYMVERFYGARRVNCIELASGWTSLTRKKDKRELRKQSRETHFSLSPRRFVRIQIQTHMLGTDMVGDAKEGENGNDFTVTFSPRAQYLLPFSLSFPPSCLSFRLDAWPRLR